MQQHMSKYREEEDYEQGNMDVNNAGFKIQIWKSSKMRVGEKHWMQTHVALQGIFE